MLSGETSSRIEVMSYREVPDRLREGGVKAVMSLLGPGEDIEVPAVPTGVPHFRIYINDIGCGRFCGEDEAREILSFRSNLVIPHREHVLQILDCARQVEQQPGEGAFIVHCSVGSSRSPAAVLLMLAERLGPGREREAVRTLFDLVPWAWPNRNLVHYGDEILGFGGALDAALDAHVRRLPVLDPNLAL